MTFPVRIEMSGHVVFAQMHALPRVGDGMTCSFPASIGKEKLLLVVTGVFHHQLGTPAGREDPEPFSVVVTVEGDPAHEEQNKAIMARSLHGKVARDA